MSKKGKTPPPKGGAARGRGAASPGRGAASPGRGRGAPPPPPPDPAPPPEVLAPPTEKDIERKRLRDVMDRKVVVWDHMMNTEAEDERRAGLEAFKRLSDDEMAMATRNLSKGKLKEFIDLKIHYFDQLANAREEEKRLEGLRRFRKVGDDEFHLAKMMGPADKLEDIVKARNERDAIDAKKEEEKKRLEKLKKQQELPKVTINMTDRNMTPQMLARQQLMNLAQLEKSATENVAQAMHGMPMQPQQDMIALQQQQLMAQAMMPPPIPPMPPSIPPPPGFYPPDLNQFQTGMPGQAMYGTVPPQFPQYPQLQQRDPNQAVALDIGNKLRLLSQLEATRQGLQAQPVGSRTSMADEIKDNLRKLNHLKMRLIDEILGEKPTGPPFDFMSFPTEQREIKKPKKERKIIVELMGPGGQDPEPTAAKSEPPTVGRWNQQPQLDHRLSGASLSQTSIGCVPQPVCPAHTCPAYQQCPAHSARPTLSETYMNQLQGGFNQPPSDQFKPEVIWERPEVKSYAEKSTMVDPPEALKYLNAAVTSEGQQVVKEVYKRSFSEEPVYQQDSPGARSPMAGTSPLGYHMMQPNYVPVLPMAMIGQGVPYEEPRVRPQHEIGIMANPYEDDPAFASRGTALPSRTGPVISKTTVVINQPQQEPAVQPMPAAPTKVVTIPQAVRIEAPAPDPGVEQCPNTRRPYDSGGNRAIHASIERLARSVDEMFDTLSSRTRSRNRAKRRSRTRSFDDDDDDDDDDEDEDDDYESRQTSRYARGRRRPRGRSRDGSDSYDDDLDDEEDISYRNRGRTSSYSRPRSRTKPSVEDDLPSLWGWLCRSLCNLTDVPRGRSDARVVQMGTRIRTLIQSVIRVSREVIEARRAIQQSGLKGEDYMNSIFEAESKLWELIDLEAQLANELAYYRQSDLANDDQYFQGLAEAEGKIRRLIGVETQLARDIGSWRKQSTLRDKPAQSKSTIYTTLSRLPSLPAFPGLPSIPFPKFSFSGLQQGAPTTTYVSTTPQTSASASTSPTTTTASTTPTASATTVAAGSGSSTPSSATTAESKKKKKAPKKKKKSKSKKSGSKKKKKGSSKSSKKKKKKGSSKSSKKKKKKKGSSKSSKKKKKRRSKSSKKKKKRRKKKKK
ncbi:unnamed protein product [Ixodes hexagonus]